MSVPPTVVARRLLLAAASLQAASASADLRIASASADAATFTITTEPEHPISPNLYSIFFETEINFGSEGGLYAELLHNRDFERLGRDKWGGLEPEDNDPQPGLDPHEPPAIPTDYSPWKAVGDAELSIDNTTAPFGTNPNSLRVRGDKGEGISNPGYWGIGVRVGVGFKLSMYALAPTAPVRFNASVRCATGEAVSSTVLTTTGVIAPGGWKLLNATLPAPKRGCGAADGGSFELTLLDDASEVVLDGVSLTHEDAVEGLFRKDIFEKIKAMKPGFVRSPGGNYLEGFGQRTRWDWKATLGPAAARPGHYNGAWGYWVTDGMGLYELLRLSELLGCASQISIYTGYSMGAPYVPLNESAPFAADAVDLLEYANGAVGSKWGARRAAMGHAAPFGLTRLEVGNEEADMASYASHYKLITDAIWKADPAVHVVASGRWGPAIDGNPCLGGARCDEWDDHYYRTPDAMAALHTAYDVGSYNRSLPRVFVGEFAANHDDTIGSLRSAVAEALFMIGFERNADVVTASSYAPLLNKMGGTQWSVDLINFNATHLFTHPSYYAQTMLSAARQATTLKAARSGGHATWAAVASASPSARGGGGGGGGGGGVIGAEDVGDVTVKMANYNASALSVTVSVAGGRAPTHIGATVLTADSPDAVNSLDEPEAVVPAANALKVQWDGKSSTFVVPMPPWSVAVLRVSFPKEAVEMVERS